MTAVEANADGLVGPTHSYAGLSLGNLASARHAGAVSHPRAAALQGLEKMAALMALGLPQFVLPPHERPNMGFLRGLGFGGDEAAVLARAAAEAPALLNAAGAASAMWAANAATVTPSADSGDGRLHLTPANLLTNLHRSLEAEQTTQALNRLLPDRALFAVHDPLPAHPAFADEGAANHVRLHGEAGPGVGLYVYGREAGEAWTGAFPARQTREASETLIRRHGDRTPVLARQSAEAIAAGAFHNDVVCVGAGPALLHHEAAFADTAGVHAAIRAAAGDRFQPVFLEVTEAELPLAEAVRAYLFNSMLVRRPGADRLTLAAPTEVRDSPRAAATAARLAGSNGPIGELLYVDVRQSMASGGGPACLRLRLSMTERELAAANGAQRLTPSKLEALRGWVAAHYRDRLAPADLADPLLLRESRAALDALTGLLDLGGGFYPFQRP